MVLTREQAEKLSSLNNEYSESSNGFSDAQLAIKDVMDCLGINYVYRGQRLDVDFDTRRTEKWRQDYHNQNFDKELPCDDMKCYGCGTPFNFHESITMINDDPYCSENCFMGVQIVDDTWSTIDATEPEELAKDFFEECTKAQRLDILRFCELMDIEFKV